MFTTIKIIGVKIIDFAKVQLGIVPSDLLLLSDEIL
jgi:hypothetical protein